MNKTSLLLAFLCVCLVDAFSQDITVKGKISTKDSLIIILTDGLKADTAINNTGEFYFIRKRSPCLRLTLIAWPLNDLKAGARYDRFLFADRGVVTINDSSITMTNPEYQTIYNDFTKWFDPLQKLRSELSDKYSSSSGEERQGYGKLMHLRDEMEIKLATSFVLAHKDNIVSPYIFGEYLFPGIQDIAKLKAIYDSLDKSLDTTYPMKLIAKAIKGRENMVTGKMALNFSAITNTGQQFSLASLKGKYVLLDFWGSWCAACVYGFRKMKQYYNLYKSNIEFVGIDCQESDEKWKAAIKKYQLTWTQVSNNEVINGLKKQYDVSSFPTKILLDREGRLVQVYVGETEDFYKKLDDLFKLKAK
ncbi:MAG: TlpA disulfide reductase family protein [Chitinophagaceae bacterium]